MNHSQRVRILQSTLNEKKLDSFLITNPKDIYYYTDFSDSGFLIVKKGGQPHLFVSPLLNGIKAAAKISFLRELKDILKQLKGRVGIDESHLTAGQYLLLSKSRIKPQPARVFITKPRMIKDHQEQKHITTAIRKTKKVLGQVKPHGKKERDIAKSIDAGFLTSGGEKAFETIVASGSNVGFIHHSPTGRVVGRNDMVIVDLGCRFNHYCSDLTRTFYSAGDKKAKQLSENIAGIQNMIADMVSPGMLFSDVQKYYEKLMKRKGYRVRHAFGHGVGLDIHERPFGKDMLEKDMVITIEPGAYFKNKGYRQEDMYLISGKGAKKLS